MRTDNYRQKDFIVPRSMREAFGTNDTFEPEIRCCSELFDQKPQQKSGKYFVLLAIVAAVIWQVIAAYGH